MPEKDNPDIPALRAIAGERLAEGDVVWGLVLIPSTRATVLMYPRRLVRRLAVDSRSGAIQFEAQTPDGRKSKPWFRAEAQVLIEWKPNTNRA